MARYDRGFGPNRGGGSMGGRRSGGYDRNMSAWWGYGRDYGWEGTRGPNVFWGREDEGAGYAEGGRGSGRGEGRTPGRGGQGGWEGDFGRGTYGGGYPEYGGYPGSGQEGMYYGRERGGWGGGGRSPSGRGDAGGYGYGGAQRGGGVSGGGRPSAGAPWYPNRYDTRYMGGYTRGYDRGIVSERVEGPSRYDAGFAREPFMPEAAYLRHPEYDRPSSFHQERWEQPGRYEIHPEKMSDEEIQQEVRQRLYQDSWLHADEIEVHVHEGVVTLRGEVGDFLEARYAWDDAWECEGARGVINNLTVRTDVPAEETHGDLFAQDAEGDAGDSGSGSGGS